MPTSSRHSTAKPLLTSVGGGVPYTPNEQRTSSYISERKRQRRQRRDDAKLRHHPTENPACRPKRKIHRRVSRFPARFSVLFPCGRSTPPEAWTSPIYPLISLRTVKKQTRWNSRRVLICQKVSQSSRPWSLEKIQSVFFAAARTPQKNTLRAAQCRSPAIAGQGVERSESRLVKKGIAFFDQAQDSSIRSLSSSSPESLRNRSSRSSTVSFARSSPATSRTIFP